LHAESVGFGKGERDDADQRCSKNNRSFVVSLVGYSVREGVAERRYHTEEEEGKHNDDAVEREVPFVSQQCLAKKRKETKRLTLLQIIIRPLDRLASPKEITLRVEAPEATAEDTTPRLVMDSIRPPYTILFKMSSSLGKWF
jgi:hypothetical protein